jgi:hypothetical protein
LLSVNIDQINPIMAFRAMVLPLIGCTILFFLVALLTHSWQKAALVAAFWVVTVYLLFFFGYVPLYKAVEKTVIVGVNIGRHRTLLVILVALLLAGTGFIVSRRGNFGTLTALLNLVAIVVMIFPVGKIVAYKIQTSAIVAGAQSDIQPESTVSLSEGVTPPDVYYIILDMYTREDVLQDFFSFDNSSFLDSLTEQGFYVADCSQSNYTSTQYSLGSSLNMDYLQTFGLDVDDPDLVSAVQQNQVMALFKQLGYRTVAFETGFSITELQNADEYFSPFASVWDGLFYGGINSFETMILKNSAGTLLYEAKPNMSRKYQTILDTPYIQYRERIEYTLDKLETVASLDGPKFVFAHILAPHDPFVFDQDGNFVYRETPFTLNNDKEYLTPGTYVAGYTSELQYLNQRVEEVVNAILAESDVPPVIILQGDHGAPRTRVINGDSAILNAYYFPGDGSEQLYATISPVNTFRLIFNQYYNGQFSLLEDRPYRVDYEAQAYRDTPGYPCPAQP